ncbi:MAG: copper homeostasis membrane protein CopD [Pseudomonadota bacterium]
MTEAALRFLQYGSLLPLAGILLDPVRLGPGGGRMPVDPRWLATVCLVVSTAAFVATVQGMTGQPLRSIDPEVVRFILVDTGSGNAFAMRSAALVVATTLLIARRRAAATPFAVLAVVTLAWTGHAANSEGIAGTAHRFVDAVHLLAAAAWLGGIAILLRMNAGATVAVLPLEERIAALRRFSATGTILVATVLLSGVYNLVAIVGPDRIAFLPSTTYGRLLGLKLLAFLSMLLLAAANRWHLTRMLDDAPDTHRAAFALRISLATELGLAVTILAAVAVLGTLDPTTAG